MQSILKKSFQAVLILFFLIAVIYLVRLYDSLQQIPLRAEHRIKLENEFEAGMEAATDWNAYRQLEQAMQAELKEKLATEGRDSLLDRHSSRSPMNPDTMQKNWNLSYEFTPDQVAGSAVLVHGLTDSPYSMRNTAELFQQHGFVSLAPRMPGHGFAVGALRFASWEDWLAVVRVSMREADQRRQPGQPLVLVGYSNGGLLAMRYALDCLQDPQLVCPDKLLLFSAAINVSPFARIANWHSLVSWIDAFNQFQWESIAPEFDPFKFTSFPKNPGREIFELASSVQTLVNNLKDTEAEFPPVLSFQSVVDDTVDARSIIELISRLPGQQHETVIYDVNQNEAVLEMLAIQPADLVSLMQEKAPFNFGITVLSNRDSRSQMMRRIKLQQGATEITSSQLNLQWPKDVYSLSHIALPFPANDPVYGTEALTGLSFSNFMPRGERKLLTLDPGYFLRLRYNPFIKYQEQRISAWLNGELEKQ